MASTKRTFQRCAGPESTTLPKLARQNKACTGIHWKRCRTQKETCMPSASKVEIFYIHADCRGTISVRFPRAEPTSAQRHDSASLFENPVFLHLQRPFFRVRPSVSASRATLTCAYAPDRDPFRSTGQGRTISYRDV